MQLDAYIPSLNVAFEYNGNHHYKNTVYQGPCHTRIDNDRHKIGQCGNLGISLITVPHWWDKTEGSLQATIHAARPDILPQPGAEISTILAHHPDGDHDPISNEEGIFQY